MQFITLSKDRWKEIDKKEIKGKTEERMKNSHEQCTKGQ